MEVSLFFLCSGKMKYPLNALFRESIVRPWGIGGQSERVVLSISSHYTSIYMTDRKAVYEKWALSTSGANPFSWEKPCPSGAVHKCVRSTPIMAGIGLPLYFRANKTSLNCLTNICMSLFVLSNTPLSNWAPPPLLYFKLFADAMERQLKQYNY